MGCPPLENEVAVTNRLPKNKGRRKMSASPLVEFMLAAELLSFTRFNRR